MQASTAKFITSKNFKDLSNLNELPLDKKGTFTITAYSPNCGWCHKLSDESINKVCDEMANKKKPCFGINAGTKDGQRMFGELGLDGGVPMSLFCKSNGLKHGKPDIKCAEPIIGYIPADKYREIAKKAKIL